MYGLNKKSSLLLFLILFAVFISSSSAAESNFYVGLTSIPRQQGPSSPYALSSIDEVIAVLDQEHSNIWRMSFPPDFNNWQQFIQYYLDHCAYDVIVDYYHHTNFHNMNSAEWEDSTNRGLQILQYFSDYQDRIWIEPQNEQTASNLVSETQQFVTAVRNAGFTNNIVSDAFWQDIADMAAITDPLDKFWTGQHIYFYSGGTENWHLGGGSASDPYTRDAYSRMQRGLNYGLKLINTEIGDDGWGQNYFSTHGVSLVNQFMEWCAQRGIGNTVWTLYGDYDYPVYQSLGLDFPVPSQLPPPETWTLTILSSSGGTVTPSGLQTVGVGTSVTVTAQANPGYYLASWNLDGSILQNTTQLTIPPQSSGSSHTLQAVFVSNSNNNNYVTITTIPSFGVIGGT